MSTAIRAAALRAVLRVAPRRRLQRLIPELHPVEVPGGLVRIGPAGDGGYLVPNDLDGLTALLSPGVGSTSAFEYEFALRGVEVFLLDASVEGPAQEHERFRFTEKFLGPHTEGNTVSLSDWVAHSVPGDDDNLVLQMDIEGAEYAALAACPPAVLRRFRIIVVEFHSLEHLFKPWRFARRARSLRRLLEHHVCVHIHPNNCAGPETVRGITLARTAEFTFLRRDRLPSGALPYASTFPHPLDADNVAGMPTVTLPSSMYRSTDVTGQIRSK